MVYIETGKIPRQLKLNMVREKDKASGVKRQNHKRLGVHARGSGQLDDIESLKPM